MKSNGPNREGSSAKSEAAATSQLAATAPVAAFGSQASIATTSASGHFAAIAASALFFAFVIAAAPFGSSVAQFSGWISVEDGMNGLEELQRSIAFLKQKRSQYYA